MDKLQKISKKKFKEIRKNIEYYICNIQSWIKRYKNKNMAFVNKRPHNIPSTL